MRSASDEGTPTAHQGSQQDSRRGEAARWLSHADPAGLLYGAVVSAAVLATVSAHADGSTFVAAATAVVLVIYWLSHVYTETLSLQFAGDQRRFRRRLRAAGVHESSVLKGGVPAITVYVAMIAAGADIGTAAAAAVYFTVGLLAGVGYLGAHRAGVSGRALLLEVAGAASFGVLIVAAKTLLH
jgi:hypothetical protein